MYLIDGRKYFLGFLNWERLTRRSVKEPTGLDRNRPRRPVCVPSCVCVLAKTPRVQGPFHVCRLFWFGTPECQARGKDLGADNLGSSGLPKQEWGLGEMKNDEAEAALTVAVTTADPLRSCESTPQLLPPAGRGAPAPVLPGGPCSCRPSGGWELGACAWGSDCRLHPPI